MFEFPSNGEVCPLLSLSWDHFLQQSQSHNKNAWVSKWSQVSPAVVEIIVAKERETEGGRERGFTETDLHEGNQYQPCDGLGHK